MNLPSIILGVLAILAMLLGGRLVPRVPMALIVLIVALIASYTLQLQALGVQVLGPVPGGFPPVAIPSLSVDQVFALLPGAVGLALLSFADTAATGRTFSEKDGEETDPDRELVALAGADLVGSLIGGYPISASPSRTGASQAAGSRTQLTGLVAAGAVLAVLLFLTGPMAYLPVPALAAVILMSALRFIDIGAIAALYRRRASEGLVATAALLGVLAYGTLAGVAIAVLRHAQRLSSGAAADRGLGRVPGTTHFANLSVGRMRRVEGVAVLRFSRGALLRQRRWPPGSHPRDRRTPGLHAVVVDIRAISDIDITAVGSSPRWSGASTRPASPRCSSDRRKPCERVVSGRLGTPRGRAPVAVDVAGGSARSRPRCLTDVAEAHARDAVQRAEAAPIGVGNRRHHG